MTIPVSPPVIIPPVIQPTRPPTTVPETSPAVPPDKTPLPESLPTKPPRARTPSELYSVPTEIVETPLLLRAVEFPLESEPPAISPISPPER